MSAYTAYPSSLNYPAEKSVPCTVIITSYNEADKIGNALRSVLWADEILLIDSFSTDKTIEIADDFPVKIHQRNYVNAADQKNFAIPLATHPIVCILDSDEFVPPELAQEIAATIQSGMVKDAYWIRRKNWFMNGRVKYSGWQGDRVVRLFKKSKGKYEPKEVHAEIDLNGLNVGMLNSGLHHNTFHSIDHFLAKTRRYARLSANDHDRKTGRIHLYHWFVKPGFRFFKHYILKLGILDGYRGIVISYVMAWGVFLRYLYMAQNRQNRL